MSAPFAGADELNHHLQYTVDPDVAALALAGASGSVRAYCGWNLSRESTTLTGEGGGGSLLTLPTLYLVSVDAARVNGAVIDLADVVVSRRGQLRRTSLWPMDSTVDVDCVHGYDETPDVVRLVTLTLAARIVNNPENAKAATVGTVTRTYDASMSALDMRLLDPFRL